MLNESPAMKEIHDIRLKIYEETKDMTPEQRTAHTNKAAEEFAKKHGIAIRWVTPPA
jgi:hypothetical protein